MLFNNDLYISFCFSYSYRNESDMGYYSEAYLTLELETGDSVSLDDLAGRPLEEYREALLKAFVRGNAPTALVPPLDYQLDRNELVVVIPSETSDWPDYYPVTYNGLRGFMDVAKLY